MDPIEKAIRTALEKGPADDKTFRESVYRKAFEALDRALKANSGITVEAAINRRKDLQSKIAEIEAEHINPPVIPAVREPSPAVAVPAEAAPVVSPEGTQSDDIRIDDTLGLIEPGPAVERLPGAADSTLVGERDERRAVRGRRRPFLRLLVTLVVLAAIAAGAWYAYRLGLIALPTDLGSFGQQTTRRTPSSTGPAVQGTPPAIAADADAQRAWITVFTPDSAKIVTAPEGASVEAMSDESGRFTRIRSGADGAPVGIPVPPAVLQKIAGKTATFDIVARAAEGKPTEIAVECRFDGVDCGRRRFQMALEHTDYLVEVPMPANAGAGSGALEISSDFSKAGKAVDVYEVKVSVTP